MKSINLIDAVASELHELRVARKEAPSFPPACTQFLRSLPGNSTCVDCALYDGKNSKDPPQWASVSYGALLCLDCSGRHRSYGVKVSVVRSLYLDSWSHSQVLSMLEGGNGQLSSFFERHGLSNRHQRCFKNVVATESVPVEVGWSWNHVRYRTKAALFYREQLAVHVSRVSAAGLYRGREAARRIAQQPGATEETERTRIRRGKSRSTVSVFA